MCSRRSCRADGKFVWASLLARRKEYLRTLISEPSVEDVDVLALLFDKYRRFYGRAGDVDGARQYVKERLTFGPTRFFVEREGGPMRGFVHLLPSFDTLAMRSMWIVEDLFVDAGARRLGIATALLTHAEQYASATGASRMTLSTAHTNRSAQRLYERLGWSLDIDFRYYQKTLP